MSAAQLSPDARCVDHLDFSGRECPDCGLAVDAYGNTEERFNDYCSFPDCGCDGSRLCGALNGPSENSCADNVEGMWSGKTRAQTRARIGMMKYGLTRDGER